MGNKNMDKQALLEIIQALAIKNRKVKKTRNVVKKVIKRNVEKKVVKKIKRKVMTQIHGSVLMTIKRVLYKIAEGPRKMFDYLKQFDGGEVVTFDGFRRTLEKLH